MKNSDQKHEWEDRRQAMVDEIAAEAKLTADYTGRPVFSSRVISAMARVPRHLFVLPREESLAYVNGPLPIGFGQTISQPYIVALMTELLDTKPEHRVLEVGTGSGYQAAILGELVREVYSIEVVPELANQAAEKLKLLGYSNVAVKVGDGSLGWPEHEPYDGIIVTAAAPDVPQALLDQLGSGGRLVVPIGPMHGSQDLLVITKDQKGRVERRSILPVAFVPLTGAAISHASSMTG